jgi:putative transposase
MPYARRDTLTWQQGMVYHIYNRGVHKVTIFREEANYLFVLAKIKKYCAENQLSLIAYCLMPNHYHFLLRQDGNEAAGNLPQSVFNSYTKAYNKRYEHSGTLFQGRFRAKAIQTRNHLLHLCRYIHGNPVKDGLVVDPADWPYSNYLEWIGERDGTLVDREFIQSQFDNAGEYRKFLFEYLKSHQLPEDVRKFLEDLEK